MASPARVPFWRSTPPAVFPPVMGLFGLALAWRRAEGSIGAGTLVSDLLMGAVTMIFLFTAVSYAAKFLFRPRVLSEDLKALPGRTGIPALSMSVMLLAAGLVPFSPSSAAALLQAGVALHLVFALMIALTLWRTPPEGRLVTPAWHLAFVGFIVAPLAAVPLGYAELALVTTFGPMIAAAGIYAVSAVQLIRGTTPPPLRPMLAIHLAPLALFGSACELQGWSSAALGFAGVATLLLLVLLARARWLTEAGFSPLWGAFTFPLASFTGLMFLISAGASWGPSKLGLAMLVFATVLLPWIAQKVLRLWIRGQLAPRTNAAIA